MACKYLFILLSCFPLASYSQNLKEDTIRVYLDTVEVSNESPATRLAGKVFSNKEIITAPGSLNDPIRVLASSAEVVTNSDLQAIPIIGGDEADGILTLLDEFSVAFPYRLLGGFSLFNPLSTANVDLLNVGFPVCYGGYAPTAISIRTKQDYKTNPEIKIDLSLPISSAYTHIPISDTLQYSAKIAFRKSHVEIVSKLLSNTDRQRLESFLPSMKDIQIIASGMPSKNIYTFQEGLLSEEKGSLNSLDRTFDYTWQKGFAGAALLTSSDIISSEHRISLAIDNVSLSTLVPIDYIGTSKFAIDCQFTMFRWQSQFQYSICPILNISAGSEILHGKSDIRFKTFSVWLNKKSPLLSDFTDASIFSDVQWTISENISTTAGIRVDYFGLIEQYGLEPRCSFDVNLSRTKIKLSAGTYLQPPSDFQILHGFLTFLAMPNQTPRMIIMSENSKALVPQNHMLIAMDAVTSIVRNENISLDCRFNAYSKQTQALILPARYPSYFTPLDTLSYEPLQCFSANKYGFGATTIVGILPLDLSISFSLYSHKSRITDKRTENEYLAVSDIPVVSKLFLQFSPASWNISLLYQYSTGMPATDKYFLKATNIFGGDLFIPIWKKLNSTRVPDYHRVDINITKTWTWDDWTVIFSLNALNIFDHKNVSNYMYELSSEADEYVIKKPVFNTLPFVPNVGLRCEFTL